MTHASIPDTLEVAAEDPRSADVAAMITRLSAELAHRYDYVDDGSGSFQPGDMDVPRSIFIVGRLHGRPVVCGAVRPLEGNVAEVKRMYVEPEVRGLGLSKRILRALEDAAVAMGYLMLRLETGNRQPEAIRLYESAGYRRIAPFGIYVGQERSICFEKQLA